MNHDGDRKRTVCGTPNYLAPELLYQDGYGKMGYSYEVDYWSIGVILYIMLVGKAPFESPEVKQTYSKIKMGMFSIPQELNIHPLAKSFIRECLTLDPLKRLTTSEMMKHDFMTRASIPKQIPISTLATPLADSVADQYKLPAANDCLLD